MSCINEFEPWDMADGKTVHQLKYEISRDAMRKGIYLAMEMCAKVAEIEGGLSHRSESSKSACDSVARSIRMLAKDYAPIDRAASLNGKEGE